MKKVVFILVFLSVNTLFSQNKVDSYKYIVLQKQYEFQKVEDQHQLNSLAKFLFEKEGFLTFFSDDQIPSDLATNSCLGLKAKINSSPSFLSTKLSIDLLDCYNNVVFSSKEGKSKQKNFTKAYHEAFRKAFVSISNLNYTYDYKPIANKEVINVENESRIPNSELKAKTKPEIISIKKPKENKVESQTKLKKEEKKEKHQKEIKPIKEKKLQPKAYNIEGQFDFKQWGVSKVVKDDSNYNVIGGSEGFVFAKIYPTSKLNIYIIKWVANKEPRLVEIDSKGDLIIDSEKTKEVYKRVD